MAVDVGAYLTFGEEEFSLERSIAIKIDLYLGQEKIASLTWDDRTRFEITVDPELTVVTTFRPRNIPRIRHVWFAINEVQLFQMTRWGHRTRLGPLIPWGHWYPFHWTYEFESTMLEIGGNSLTYSLTGKLGMRHYGPFKDHKSGRTEAVLQVHGILPQPTPKGLTKAQGLALQLYNVGWTPCLEIPREVMVPEQAVEESVVQSHSQENKSEVMVEPAPKIIAPEPITVQVIPLETSPPPATIGKIEYTVVLAGRRWVVGNKTKVTVHHSQINEWTMVVHFPQTTENFCWWLTQNGRPVDDSQGFNKPDNPWFENFWIAQLSPGYYTLEIATDYGLSSSIGIEVSR